MKATRSVVFSFLLFSISTSLFAAPARVTDLKVTNVGPGNITVAWTTPAPAAGQLLMENDVRISPIAITALNWATRTTVAGEPVPITPGTLQTSLLTGLNTNTTYYVGLKVRDGATGWSLLSNVIMVTTSAAAKTADLSWSNPQLAGFRSVQLCQSKDPSFYTTCVELTTQTAYTFTGLTYGTPDYFEIRALYDNTLLKADHPENFETNPNIPNSIYSPWSTARKD